MRRLLLVTLLGAGGCFLDSEPDDDVCIEYEVTYGGSATGDLYARELRTFDRETGGLANFGDSVAALEGLAPNPNRGVVVCSGPGATPIEHEVVAWIDVDGDEALPCARSISDPACGPNADDPSALVVLDLAPGTTLIRLDLQDP